MMRHEHYAPHFLGGIIGPIIFLALIVLFVYVGIRYVTKKKLITISSEKDTAFTILAERYAKGELSDEEYTHKRDVLKGKVAVKKEQTVDATLTE